MNVRFFSLLMSLRIKNCDLSDSVLPFIYAGSSGEGPKGLTRTFHLSFRLEEQGSRSAPCGSNSPSKPTAAWPAAGHSGTLISHRGDQLARLRPAQQPSAVSSFSLGLGWVQVLVPELPPVRPSLAPLPVQTQQ